MSRDEFTNPADIYRPSDDRFDKRSSITSTYTNDSRFIGRTSRGETVHEIKPELERTFRRAMFGKWGKSNRDRLVSYTKRRDRIRAGKIIARMRKKDGERLARLMSDGLHSYEWTDDQGIVVVVPRH